jgi:hypothetical protein
MKFFLFYSFFVRILKHCLRYLSSNTPAFPSAALLSFIIVVILSTQLDEGEWNVE